MTALGLVKSIAPAAPGWHVISRGSRGDPVRSAVVAWAVVQRTINRDGDTETSVEPLIVHPITDDQVLPAKDCGGFVGISTPDDERSPDDWRALAETLERLSR